METLPVLVIERFHVVDGDGDDPRLAVLRVGVGVVVGVALVVCVALVFPEATRAALDRLVRHAELMARIAVERGAA